MPSPARYLALLLPLLVRLVSLGEAQAMSPPLKEPPAIFEHLSGEDGLPGSAITGIAQDEKGFLWIGTDDGLARYDGYNLMVYRHDPLDSRSLASDRISTLYQDRSGNLWIGTSDGGLNRLSAESGQFRCYRHEPDNPGALSDDRVTALYEDRAGRFWVATSDGILQLLNRDTGQVDARYQLHTDSRRRGEGMQKSVTWIEEIPDSATLWLAVGQSGIINFDPETGAMEPVSLPESTFRPGPESASDLPSGPPSGPDSAAAPKRPPGLPPIQALQHDEAGAVWIGLERGLLRVDRAREEMQSYDNSPSAQHGLSNDSINTLYTDRAGKLWIGTAGGLNRFNPQSRSFHWYDDASGPASSAISVIYEDRSGGIWIGTTDGSGLYMFHPDRLGFQLYAYVPGDPDSLSHDDISAVLEDAGGSLWIGYRNKGLDRIDPQSGAIRHYAHERDDPGSLAHNNVSALLEDRDGTIWVGTQGGGLTRFDREHENFQPFMPDAERFIRMDQPESPDTKDGPPGGPPHLLSPFITALYEDSRGMLWIGTVNGGGLYRYDAGSGDMRQYQPIPATAGEGLSSVNISTIAEDSQGLLWIGTSDGGLNVFDPQADRFRQYTHTPNAPDGLSSNSIWAIHEDRTGRLWIGTSSGLNAFDREHDGFRVYRRQDDLASDVIYGIQEENVSEEQDGVYLWLSTSNGLLRFDPREEHFQHYDTDDGLQGNVFNPGADHDGRSGTLYFGGKYGLNAFSPLQFSHNTHVPPIVMTEFRMFNQIIRPGKEYTISVKRGDTLEYKTHPSPLTSAIAETDEIVLSYREDTLAFEFAALDFMAPRKNRYAYMMEGFDDRWTYSGARRLVQYTNLPSGTYTFRVKGSNNDGVWNEQGTSIRLIIQPPFWETWWFRMLLWGALAGLAATAYFMRIARIKAQTRKLETLVQQRTQELHEYTIRLEDEVFERTQAERSLQDTHEELKATFENLQRTQTELVESEKMAALGQLVAGIAHEINTPIGAIRASVGNISQGLQQTTQHLPPLLQQLAPEQQDSFLELLRRSVQDKPALSSREERKLRRALQRELDSHDLEEAADIADTLVDMGIYDDISAFIPLFREQFGEHHPLKTAYHLSMQHHHSRNIQTAVERASKIVFALKRYTHYDTSGEKIEANVVEGLDAVLTLYHNQLKRGVDVNKRYEEIPDIRCYPDELNQVWTNLVHNAIQAMDGKGRLEIAVSSGQSSVSSEQAGGDETRLGDRVEGHYVNIQITDSGHGIPDEVKARIFEPFFTTRAAGEGSGLGLDICRKIIEKHQGTINVESQPGQTTFSVFLPIG